jgi:hypothetical protein
VVLGVVNVTRFRAFDADALTCSLTRKPCAVAARTCRGVGFRSPEMEKEREAGCCSLTERTRVYDYSGRLLRSTPMEAFIKNAGLDPIPPENKCPSNGAAESKIR